MKIPLFLLGMAALVGGATASIATSSAAEPVEPIPLFAMDNALNRIKPLEEKVTTLKALGYAGIGWRPGQTREMQRLLKQHGLKMFTTYVTVRINEGQSVLSPQLLEEMEALKGSETRLWLVVNGRVPSDDLPVEAIRQIADKAAEAGLRVTLYPHVGAVTDTVDSCLRLAKKAGRDNVGVSFNLCHFLKQHDAAGLEDTLRRAAPHLDLVQVSGADAGDTRNLGWNQLIQPIGKGSFDLRALLKLLAAIGYDGPVAMQAYAVPGDNRENLEQSMRAWRALAQPETAASVPSTAGS